MPNINFQITDSAKKAKPVSGVSNKYVLEIDVMPPPEKYSGQDVKFGDKKYNVSAGPRKKDANKGYISFSSTDESYLPNGDYVFVTEINELYTKDDFNSAETQTKVKAAVKIAQKQPDLAIVAGALKDLQDKIKTMSDEHLDLDQQQIVNGIITYYAPTLANPPRDLGDQEPTSVTVQQTKNLLDFGPAGDEKNTGVPGIIAEIAGKNEDFRSFMLLGRANPTQLTDDNAQKLHDNLMLMVADLSVDEKEIKKMLDAIKTADEVSEADLTVTDADFKTGQQQISAILRKIKKIVDEPGDAISIGEFPGRPNTSTLDTAALGISYAASEFNDNETYNDEIDAAIGTVENNTADLPSAQPFLDRPGQAPTILITTEKSKSSNDDIAMILRDFGGPYFNYLLSQPDSAAALKLLKAGKSDKLTSDDQKRVYKNVLAFTALFGTKGKLEKMLDESTVNPDGSVSAPAAETSGLTGTSVTAPAPTAPGAAPTAPAGGPGDATGGSAAPTGAVTTGAVATSGGGSGSASSNGGSAQPGAAAEVTDIAVAAVRILNARPAPVQVFMDFGPPRSADIEQPLPLQWTIDPAYFSGYQLQINDSQRAIIAQYKNQQVILRVSATPLTGGRPVEVKQPLSIRSYRLPDQAELIPIKTFTFGRLAGTQSVSPEPAAQGGARDFSKRVAEVPCFFYKADGGVGAPAGDAVGVTSAASGRTYRFDFPEGFLVPIRIKFDDAKNPKTASKLEKLRQEQGLLSESKGKLLKEAGVPHWIFLKRRGALDSGRGGAGGGADAGADADAAGGLRVNIAVKTIVISTTDKLRVVGNSGNPWDASSFKAAFYPGKGAQFVKDEFPNAGLILCDDDFGLFSGLDRGAVMTAMYRVLFTDRAPDSSAYKLVGLQKWADDIRVIGSNPEVSATARRKPDNLFASS